MIKVEFNPKVLISLLKESLALGNRLKINCYSLKHVTNIWRYKISIKQA